MTNIHTLPGAVLPDQQIAPNQDVVLILEDLLQLAKEGKIQSIAHAYVTNAKEIITGWRLAPPYESQLSSGIHRLAYRYEALCNECGETDMPSKRT